ncbi:integrase, partial [Escherichia albertii B156]
MSDLGAVWFDSGVPPPQIYLNNSKIRKLKPSSRPVKLPDSHGLYLLVNPGGSHIWYLKYRFNGKESRASLSAY